MHPCLLPLILCSRNRFVSFETVEDVKEQLQNVDFCSLRSNVSVATVHTLWQYRSSSWTMLCIFPMQKINLELRLAGFPKSVPPPLVPRSQTFLMCSADRSDHHHGCPVDQHRNICTTSWHAALSLFHYHTPPSIGDAFRWAKYIPCCFCCYNWECSSSFFFSVTCSDGCPYSCICFGAFFYFCYCRCLFVDSFSPFLWLLIKCYFVVFFWVDYIYGGSWGEFRIWFVEGYCIVYFKTIRSYMQGGVTVWRLIILPLKGWKSSNIWERR